MVRGDGMTDETKRRGQGFASMPPEQQKAIASRGGKAAHVRGTAHEFTPAEAKVAGAKGGQKVSSDREHMARIGRLGGLVSGGRNRKPAQPAPPPAPETQPDVETPDALE